MYVFFLIIFLILIFYCYSITVVCPFSLLALFLISFWFLKHNWFLVWRIWEAGSLWKWGEKFNSVNTYYFVSGTFIQHSAVFTNRSWEMSISAVCPGPNTVTLCQWSYERVKALECFIYLLRCFTRLLTVWIFFVI